mmetsp:Transcript_21107/g.56237  ORF Transcript_21107/g.56237 Transcript_21107/m.56237 type:complete len:587 (-) Transcript_21107:41-1801(-)
MTPWTFRLSACILPLVLGNFMHRELSILGNAVPEHRLALHNLPEVHDARVSSAVGQSLVAGVDAPPEPDVQGLVSRLGIALRPFQERYLLSRRGQRNSCSGEYEMEKPNSFLAGCPRSGCSSFASLEEAKGHCESLTDCGGITAVGQNFQVRLESKQSPSKTGESCWVRRCGKESTASEVWKAFHSSVSESLNDKSLNFDAQMGPAREDDSIFISIAAYRDPNCQHTLRHAFLRATHPERLSAGIIQLNCQQNCTTATGWGETRKIVPGDPDPDCAEEFCASDLGQSHCQAGRVRILRLDETDALGPFFSRFLVSKLWRGENFFMQVDAHTNFRSSWDLNMVDMMRSTPTYPKAVISAYPDAGRAADDRPWDAYDKKKSERPQTGLCGCIFEEVFGGKQTIRLGNHDVHPLDPKIPFREVPHHTSFVAAGFFVTHGAAVEDVPFDPYLPFIFMGEEAILSMRFWTSGYDIYAPTVSLLRHEYVRRDSQKFWESVNMVFSATNLHNEISGLVLSRIHRFLGFPGGLPEGEPESLLEQFDVYSAGKSRSAAAFAHAMGLDYAALKQTAPSWCYTGKNPPDEDFAMSEV